jgi:hypothetical protein
MHPVICRWREIPTAEIPLRRGQARVAEQHLDLLEFSIFRPAELRARSAVMPHAA